MNASINEKNSKLLFCVCLFVCTELGPLLFANKKFSLRKCLSIYFSSSFSVAHCAVWPLPILTLTLPSASSANKRVQFDSHGSRREKNKRKEIELAVLISRSTLSQLHERSRLGTAEHESTNADADSNDTERASEC
jgi:hypothetical protein